MTQDLSEADVRLLEFCRRYPVWHSLGKLGQVRLLRPGDVASVCGLIEKGYLAWNGGLISVGITDAGAKHVSADIVSLDCSAETLAGLIEPIAE